jgi:hypothetical protein
MRGANLVTPEYEHTLLPAKSPYACCENATEYAMFSTRQLISGTLLLPSGVLRYRVCNFRSVGAHRNAATGAAI